MDINFGAEVIDSKGQSLGTVSNVVRDSWSGEIRKFGVKSPLAETLIFYSPEVIESSTSSAIRLKVAFGEVNVTITYGAKVVDGRGKTIGKVDSVIKNSVTGEVTGFKVGLDPGKDEVLFRREDVESANPSEIVLKADRPEKG
jgi:sporulation protein YlmC with PRC-barrel domain